MATVETKLDNIETMVKEIKDSIKEAEKKYAAKWVEWIIKGAVAIILVGVFGAMVNEFVRKPSQSVVQQVKGISTSPNE